MLNSVRNWCFYKISLVHLLFSTVCYIFNHISVGFGPINMFLGMFQRVFKGLQKTSPNQSRQVHFNWYFCSLYISKMKRRDCRSSLLWSWSGLVMVFSSYETGLPNTTYIHKAKSQVSGQSNRFCIQCTRYEKKAKK